MDIGLEEEENLCLECGRDMENCKYVGECDPEEVKPGESYDTEFREEMSNLKYHLDERVKLGHLDKLAYNGAKINLLKRLIKQLIESKNHLLKRLEK